MTNSTETNPILTPELLQSLLTKAKNAAHDGRLDEADELADDFICKFGDHYSEEIIQISETQWRESLVFYLSSRGERFENKKMYSEALSNYERIIEIASDNEGLPLTNFVHYPYAKIEAMWRCALMLDRLKRGDEAYYILSRIQRDLKAKYQYNSDVSIAVYYSKSMLKQAAILEKTGKTKKALRTLDRRFLL
jgi:tetratricopeptide (TPR) repeat protein